MYKDRTCIKIQIKLRFIWFFFIFLCFKITLQWKMRTFLTFKISIMLSTKITSFINVYEVSTAYIYIRKQNIMLTFKMSFSISLKFFWFISEENTTISTRFVEDSAKEVQFTNRLQDFVCKYGLFSWMTADESLCIDWTPSSSFCFFPVLICLPFI